MMMMTNIVIVMMMMTNLKKKLSFSGEQGVRREAEQGPVAECLHRGKDSQFLVSQEKIHNSL